ncbi:Fe2+-dicitrate sensor, membrane component [Candidatus Burkholderia humilis]|nr:Fe2+-dicitrate sensor, membrane component [Candidatus Burkholderia humilis]
MRRCASTMLADARRAEWTAWLDERPEHRRAWAHIEAVSRRFNPLRADGEGTRAAASTAMRVAARGSATRRKALGCIVALCGAGLAGWFSWRFTPLPDAVRDAFRLLAGVGEQRDITLTDGTHVWLNTDSAFDAHYNDERRLIVLEMGEILVDTAKDAHSRPFFVDTRHGRMQALGTRFTVRQAEDFTLLTVFDGRVEIKTRSGETRMVSANEQRRFDTSGISDSMPAEIAREAWSRGVIIADNVPLARFVAELSHYTRGHIAIAPSVVSIRVVGRFPADRPEQVLAMLERDLPVRVHRPLPFWTSISSR